MTVLVSEAHTIGALAVIRSLGSAGHRVIAISPRGDAIGFFSRFVACSHQAPAYGSPEFLSWLDALILEEAIHTIIASESFSLAIREHADRLLPLLAVEADAELHYGCLSKAWVHQQWTDPTQLPHSRILTGLLTEDDRSWLAAVPTSFLKVDGVNQISTPLTGRSRVHRTCVTDAAITAKKLLTTHTHVLAQHAVPGIGIGACFLRWNGQIVATMMHRRLREVPYQGGVSSCREVWHHSRILADAQARLETLNWNGLAMLEYRWDPGTDAFHFIELNSRVWGSMHLALLAGVDFPALLCACRLGETPAVPAARPARARVAFPLDFQHLLSVLHDPACSTRRKLGSTARFFADFANPQLQDDFAYPRDGLRYRAFRQYLRRVCR